MRNLEACSTGHEGFLSCLACDHFSLYEVELFLERRVLVNGPHDTPEWL